MRFSFFIFAIILVSISFPMQAADSLGTSLLHVMDISPLRGIDSDGGIIFAFAKSPKLYSISYLCGGSAVILDSISWSGSTIPSGTNMTGRWIHVDGNYAFLADWNCGIHIIDISDPFSLRDVGGISLSGQPRSVFAVGDSLYISSNAAGVHLVDISDPESASAIGNYETGGAALDAVAWENRAMFIAEDPTGISAWDLATPSDPLGWLGLSGTAVGVEFCGAETLIAAVEFEGALHILNAAVPAMLTIVETLSAGDDYLYRAAFSDDLLLAAAGESGIWIYDLFHEGSTPDYGFYSPDACNIVDVTLFNDVACAADADGKIWFVDLSGFGDRVPEFGSQKPTYSSIEAFPVPFNSSINLRFSGFINRNLREILIFDILGRLIDSIDIVENRGEYVIEWRPRAGTRSGIYFVKPNCENSLSKKIIYLK